MENGKDSLKTHITGLKNGCFSGGPTEKLSNSSADRKIVEVRSQRYSKLYELHRKIKQSLQKNGLISMHIPSLYANTLQAEDINIVCTAYEHFSQKRHSSVKTFQFNEQNYLQTHGTAMITKKRQ